MIIGITGPICAGKDEAGKLLAKRGFERLSLVEEIREELRKRGTEITRKNLQDLGDALRHSEGVDSLARRVMKKIISGKHYTIESIRNPGEVQALRELDDFILICITASEHLRFERMVARGREQDPRTIDEFLQVEARDRGIGQASHAQQNEACWKLADFTFANENSLEHLEKSICGLIGSFKTFPFQPVHVTTSLPSEQAARDLVRTLLEKRAIACGQIVPSQSLFWWNGKIQEVNEWLCFLKGKNFSDIEQAIRSVHPYELPEIIQISLERGNSDYMKWLAGETSQ